MQDCFKGFYFSLFPCSFACRFATTKLGFLVESVNLATLGENVVRLLFFFWIICFGFIFYSFFFCPLFDCECFYMEITRQTSGRIFVRFLTWLKKEYFNIKSVKMETTNTRYDSLFSLYQFSLLQYLEHDMNFYLRSISSIVRDCFIKIGIYINMHTYYNTTLLCICV